MRRFTLFALLAALLVSLPALSQDIMSTAIGGGPNGIPAIDGNLYNPYGVAVDGSGNFYITVYNNHRVYKVSTAGTITVVAGNGVAGYSGDGVTGGAANATLNHPEAVAVDGSGNVYIADFSNCVIRKVDTTSTISTIAGTAGTCNSTNLNGPAGVALDSTAANLYVSDYYNCVVRKVVLATKAMSTFAGNGTCGYSGDGGSATAAELSNPDGIGVDTAGNVYIGDTSNYVIREVTKSNGHIATIAGNHTYGFSGDGGLATSAMMTYAYGLTVSATGNVVTFADYANQRVRQFTVGSNINTVAGNGTPCAGTCGEGGAATSAELYNPWGIAQSSGGTFYLADNSNYVADTFTIGGNLNLAAGNHTCCTETLVNNIPPQGVVLNYALGITSDSSGNMFVADTNNNMVRELVKSTNLVKFFAGTGTAGYTGDGGAATSAELNNPRGVAKDSAGNIYITDFNNCLVREVNTAGNISTFAGLVVSNSPRCGYTGDGGPATSAELYQVWGIAVDSKNNVYITDAGEHVVRKVSGGTITTIAGIGGIAGYSGDGGPATSALLYTPTGVAVDPAGNVFISEYQNCRVREINAATGIITTVAGTGSCTFTGDGLATSNAINGPGGLTVDNNDNIFIGDTNNQRVRWVSPSGFMTTIAGTQSAGFLGDGVLATTTNLYYPEGVGLDPSGNVLIADDYDFRIRSVSAFPALSTSVSSLSYGLTAVGNTSSPQQFTVSAYGPVTISNIAASTNYSEADNCPASLTNGTTCAMYVYFVPTASGTLNGNVTINSNGFFSQTSTVSLTGLGSSVALSGSPLAFGNELVKTTSAAKTVTVTDTGTAAITMGTITSTNTTDYTISANTCPASGAKLNAGSSCTISVTFNPKSTGAKRGTVVVNDSDPSSPQLIGLNGTGSSNVVLNPNSITFPVTAIGVSSAASKITVTNNTGASITLGNPAVSTTGPFTNAGSTTCTNSLVIAASGTCVINVTFKPALVGYNQGTVSLADSDVTSPQAAQLQGYGTAIKFTPTTVNFGTVTRGQTVSSTVTISNVGTTNVFFTGAELSGTNSADFGDNYGDSAPCGNTASNPLKPGGTCQISVTFDPSKVGTENAVYKVFDNTVGSPQTLSLTGKGQ